MKTVAVVILNWNGQKWLERFLSNVLLHSNSLADIVVIDNGSTDDSQAFCQSQFPEVKWISLNKNHGFAGGYNEGLKGLDYKYFMLLNSDVEVTADWLTRAYRDWETDRKSVV